MPEIEPSDRFQRAALQIEEESRLDAEKHYAAETPWFRWNYFLGVPLTLLSALASAAAFSSLPNSEYIAGGVALLAAVLSALFTFLDPSKKANVHHSSAKSSEALYRKARLFREVGSFRRPVDEENLERQIQALLEEYNQIKANALPVPARAYRFVAKLPNGSREVTQVRRMPS